VSAGSGSILSNEGKIFSLNGDGVDLASGLLTNTDGTIRAALNGVDLAGANSSVSNRYGTIAGGTNSVLLSGSTSIALVGPWSTFNGTINGGNIVNNNILNFDLTGLTPGEVTQYGAYIAAHPNSGAFTVHGVTYTWANFTGHNSVNLTSYETQARTSNQRNVASALDNINTVPSASLLSLLQAFDGFGNVPVALDQLSPQRLQVWRNIAFDNFGFAAQQLDDHTASRRYGQGGFDTSGFQVMDSSMPSMMSQIKSRLLAWNPSPADSGLMTDVADPILGGVKMNDKKDMREFTPEDANRWSAFISGNVILADVSSDPDVAHTNYTTSGVTAGADFRLGKTWAVGGLFGYGHTDADLDNSGSHTRVDSYSPGIYATYADHGWYANGLFAYNYNSYNERRAIEFDGTTANGSPDGNQFDGNLDGGYEFHRGPWTYGPTAALQFVHLDINRFTETGAGAADLAINDQNADSLRSRLGGEVRYQTTWGKGTATPHLSASWQHEFLDNSSGITSQFDGQGVGSFVVNTSSPDRDSAMIDAGLDTQWNSFLTLFLDYQA
ncbi:MAG TPA: autotransporter outer membrane beta-barrel domain-containing protein, partial [Candidatus Methylacidiphilales bacterium]